MRQYKFDILYWGKMWNDLRKAGEFKRADELREMIRRLGFELIVKKDGYEIKPIYTSYE